MKNKIKKIGLTMLLASLAIFIVSCGEIAKEEQLSIPSNIAINDNVVTWNAVSNATNYTVKIDNDETTVTQTKYTILINEPGTYSVRVRANGTGNYKNSDYSAPLEFTVEEPAPVFYSINETFDNLDSKDEWNLGEVTGMHDVKNGQLILTNTGVTPYPSRGKRMKVSLDKYPYLAVKVDEVGGNNTRWAIKIKLDEDETPSRSVTANDMSISGLFFFDLTKVDGLKELDVAEFDLYIYVVEAEDNYIKIDYIQSAEKVPGVNNFDNEADFSVTDGTMTVQNGVLVVESDANKVAKLTFDMYLDTDITNMLDLFVNSLEEGSKFSLKLNDNLVIDEANRYGHFGVDLVDAEIEIKDTATVLIEVDGKVSFDQIANKAYDSFELDFSLYDDETIYDLVGLSGSADVSIEDDELVIYRIHDLGGDAKVSFNASTNFSTYPKFVYDVADLTQGDEIKVYVNGTLIKTVTESGSFDFNLTTLYISGLNNLKIDFVLVSSGDATATISGFTFERDEEYSKDALPEKGEKIEREGMILEEGNDADNWGGNSTVISRNGQIWIINTDYFSKGEVFGRNIDLSDYRYLNIMIDELTSGATWKLDVTYNVGMSGEFTVGVQSEINETGLMVYDLYKLLNLNENNKVTQRISINFFIIGGNDKIAKLDYLRISQEPEYNEIINVTPSSNKIISIDEPLNVGATLKFPLGEVSIVVKNDQDEDVTDLVLENNIFKTDVIGTYKIYYSYEDLTVVERIVTVTEADIISTNNSDETIKYNETVLIYGEVENNSQKTVTYKAFFDDVDVTDEVLSLDSNGATFTPTNSGVYKVVLSSEGLDSIELTYTVVTGWINENYGNNTNYYENGLLVMEYSGGWHYPSHELNVTVHKEKPFLVVDVNDITGGNWKLDVDGHLDDAIPQNSEKGLRIIDLRPFLGSNDSLQIKFKILIVGSDIRLELSAFEFLSELEIAHNYNAIVNVLPNSNKKVEPNGTVLVSAELKYPISNEEVSIKVLNSDEDDVTSEVLIGGVFKTSIEGEYTLYFMNDYAETVTRVIKVLLDPVINSNNPSSEDIIVETVHNIDVSVSNPTPEGELSYVVTMLGDDTDITSLVFDVDTKEFMTDVTGTYVLTISYPDADDLVLTLVVKTDWVLEDPAGGTVNVDYNKGKITIHYEGDFYWPKSKTVIPITTDNTPYLVLDIESITGGTWKLGFGDPYEEEILETGDHSGVIIFDLRDYVAASGYGETHKELNMTLNFYIVGSDVTLKINSIKTLTQAEYDALD
ncbi:MAG: hypothetical protein WC907_04275 [Acholeplasmataceae bacterium]